MRERTVQAQRLGLRQKRRGEHIEIRKRAREGAPEERAAPEAAPGGGLAGRGAEDDLREGIQ